MGYALLASKTDGLRYGSWGKQMKTLTEWQKDLKPAEQKLLACCQSGEIAVIGKERPIEKTEENEIRASFLRWLILTKEVEIDPHGIQVRGTRISGTLDLDNVVCEKILNFNECSFEETFYLRRATTKAIYLDGSLCEKGISGDGLVCYGDLFLRNDFEAKAEVRFLGAKVEGDFDCPQSTFKAFYEEQDALSCDGITVNGAVSLIGSNAEGEVRFLNAKVEGNFDCSQATFKAFSAEQKALNCDGMNVVGSLLMREECEVLQGIVDLTSATVGSLVDDKNFWEQKTLKHVELDGFKYGHIYGSTSASFRLEKMLGKMPKDEFSPQPYKQLAKVLRDMGHDRDADEVMIALRDKQLDVSKESWLYIVFRYIYKWTSGYGYRPMRALGIMLFLWLACGVFYEYSAKRAVFAPTNPLIYKPMYQDQPQETNCTLDANGTPWLASAEDYNTSKNNWYYATHAEYTTFHPYWYSLDILLPIVDLKMENDWSVAIPSPNGSFFETFNYCVRLVVWLETILGWILGLMLVAILSGLAKNEKE